MRRLAFCTVAALALAACGHQTPAENTADQLDRAAAQSDPAAAPALENAADAIRDGNAVDPQAALSAGGNAQEGTPSPTATGLAPRENDMLVANRTAPPR